ncbi:MAG TPA: hypothetical protein VF365_13540 [Candidatus Limnocylindria bacterium]
MEPNLPATREDVVPEIRERPLPAQRPLSVAFLPLALITFIVLAFVIAAWSFLSTAA